jgi:hypothetical protein
MVSLPWPNSRDAGIMQSDCGGRWLVAGGVSTFRTPSDKVTSEVGPDLNRRGCPGDGGRREPG